MNFLGKTGNILMILIFIYFWNKYIVTQILKKITGFHKKYNLKNINKQPIKFVINKELKIIKLTQYFYWIGAIIISFQILFK